MGKFFKRLLAELLVNGKSLLAWLMLEIPGISDYPGLVTALNAWLADPSKANLINLAWQALFAGASGHRLIKILANVLKK